MKDSEVIKKVLSGNPDIFEVLVLKYKDRAMSLALSMVKNKQDAEEVLQESFIKAYLALSKFEERSSFSTWFYKIVFNTCQNFLIKSNKKNSRHLHDDTEDNEWLSQVAINYDDPAKDLDNKQLAEHITEAIENLPDLYRLVINLFFIQELSIKEISELTKFPIGTVKVKLFRGRALIQSVLRKNNIWPKEKKTSHAETPYL